MPIMNDFDYIDYSQDYNDSDEDTEDASETESMKYHDDDYDYEYKNYIQTINGSDSHNCQIMYQVKMAELENQLTELRKRTHPDFVHGLRLLEQQLKDRLFYAQCVYDLQLKFIDREFELEKKAAAVDFEERKLELKESTLVDLEESRKTLEIDANLELTNESVEPKSLPTRKLRRRPNDPTPMPDRRRRTSPTHINYMLEDYELNEDIKMINKFMNTKSSGSTGGGSRSSQSNSHSSSTSSSTKSFASNISANPHARIEYNKLFYDRKWFCRGQEIYLESSDGSVIATTIHHIGNNEIITKKSNDSARIKVTTNDLQSRRYFITKI